MNYTPLNIYKYKLKYIFEDNDKVVSLIIGELVVLLILLIIYGRAN